MCSIHLSVYEKKFHFSWLAVEVRALVASLNPIVRNSLRECKVQVKYSDGKVVNDVSPQVYVLVELIKTWGSFHPLTFLP